MKNTLRTRQWMAIRRHINKCTDAVQLSALKEIVLKYHDEKKQDSGELLALYVEHEAELNPETFEDETLTEQHKKLSV